MKILAGSTGNFGKWTIEIRTWLRQSEEKHGGWPT